MPTSSILIEIQTLNSGHYDTILTEKGHIVAASLFPEQTGSGANELYGEIWLTSIETPEPTKLAMLVSGHFGVRAGISWFGYLPSEPSLGITGYFWSSATNMQKARLSVVTDI